MPLRCVIPSRAQVAYAFQRDLEARGLADRVLTLVWSELGRRPLENASAGADHSAAGCGFVIGTQAAGQMIGEWPGWRRGQMPSTSSTTTIFARSGIAQTVEWTCSGE
jgi:uncharacterized protein (DUF1501 family)